MLSHRSVMTLLAVLTLSAKVAESAIAAPDVCSETDVGKGFCLTCKMKAKCVNDKEPPEERGECTVAGEVCTVLSGVATCKPNAETECSCDAAAQCDAYDPDSVLICLNGGMIHSRDCSATAETCDGGECVAPVTDEPTLAPNELCAGAEEGFVVIPPRCTSAAYCLGDGVSLGISDCPSGKYFDMDGMTCLPLPPVPCAAGCSDGACPDKSDCSKWYICSGGVVVGEEICPDATPNFDIVTNECLEMGTCTGNDKCTYGLTTVAATTTTTAVSGGSTGDGSSSTVEDSSSTGDGSSSTGEGSSSTGDGSSSTGESSSSTGDGSSSTTSGIPTTSDSTTTTSRPALCTAANVGQRYPYAGDCKKYWTCYEVSNGAYRYVESTCLGDYLFNPNTGYCDLPENVTCPSS